MSAEKRFLKLLDNQWQGATPGFLLQAHQAGRKKISVGVGETYRFYDWASLTKIVFTATQLMWMVEAKKLKLSDAIARFAPWYVPPTPFGLQLKDLLSHSAGLTWWYPFYKEINRELSRAQRWQQLEQLVSLHLSDTQRASGTDTNIRKAVYSDLDLFVLGSVIKRVEERDFNELFAVNSEKMGLSETFYHVDNKPKFQRKLYAPTEECDFRKCVVQGEVHDENTWSLGGVAPHAGLFGPIGDLTRFGLLLRQTMRGSRVRGFPKPEIVGRFTRRAVPKTVGDWASGFMMPTKGSASCGRYFSPLSVGHTGFTGTSLWYDPKRDLLITILSNRVHPTRTNSAFVKLRPLLHNWVVEALTT